MSKAMIPKRRPGSGYRHRAPRRIGGLLPPGLRTLFRKQGFASEKIVTRWPEIVGDEIAEFSLPVKLRRNRGRGGGSLELHAEGGYVTEIKHLEPLVIDRINTYFGFAAVDRLSVVQAPVPIRHRAGAAKHVEPAARDVLAVKSATRQFRDPELRAAVERLGLSMASDTAGDGEWK